MSWAPVSSSGAEKENSPSANLSKSLKRVQGLRMALGENTPARQQLFPSDVLKSRLHSALQASGESTNCSPRQSAPARIANEPQHTNMQLVHAPQQQVSTEMVLPTRYPQALYETEEHLSQHPSIKAGSQGTLEFERSSAGTWNSPKEMAPSSPSTEVQGAPLPAPLHIIEAIGEPTSAVRRRPSFSTASLVLSGGPMLQDDKENKPLDAVDIWAVVETNQDHVDETDPNAQASSAAAVRNWDLNKRYPIVHFMTLDRDPRTDDCDIDPETGELIPPVRYIKLQKDGEARSDWRRNNLSSENRIIREIARREELRKEVERREQEAKYENMDLTEDAMPDAACTLRPVETKDFKAIVDIINLERSQGRNSQVYLHEVGIDQVAALYHACLGQHRPFVVAIPSPNRGPDRSNWSKAEEKMFQEFLEYRKSRETSQPTVLGFAFITDARQNFLGGACRGSRFSGNIKMIVHPDYRRKLVGTALLDRIMSCVNIYHHNEIEYNWACSDTRRTYEYVSAHNLRKYNKVYVEAFSIGEHEHGIEHIQRLLINKFDFKLVANFKDAVKHGNNPGIWKNLHVWELEVRPASEIVENPDDM
ncbi:acyl- n-acyltransferase [Fusarium longipes]|uniref:Acyl-n-acyltransferase n=1 Tax=Fusarium longipes TaxID=694270 RepID=A0A395T8T7_9HYPO|nr:acyl- n-acyltransferase [Fusarium longipes]